MFDPVQPMSRHHVRHHRRSYRRQEAKRWAFLIHGWASINPKLGTTARRAHDQGLPCNLFCDVMITSLERRMAETEQRLAA